MNVAKRMVILTGVDNDSQGVLKLDKIGAQTTAQLNLYSDVGKHSVLCLQLGNSKPYVAKIDTKKSAFDLPHTVIDGEVKCMVVSGNKPILAGSSIIKGMDIKDFLGIAMPILEELFKDIKEILPNKENIITMPKNDSINNSFDKKIDEVVTSAKEIFSNAKPAEEISFANVETLHRGDTFKRGNQKEYAQDNSVQNVDKENAMCDCGDRSGRVYYDNERRFFDVIQPQIAAMFETYPSFVEMEARVPNSRWIKVDTGEDFYVIGILSEYGAPRYLCYGVPANKEEMPPDKVDENCQWLSRGDDPNEGYYMMYQDCTTGETVVNFKA